MPDQIREVLDVVTRTSLEQEENVDAAAQQELPHNYRISHFLRGYFSREETQKVFVALVSAGLSTLNWVWGESHESAEEFLLHTLEEMDHGSAQVLEAVGDAQQLLQGVEEDEEDDPQNSFVLGSAYSILESAQKMRQLAFQGLRCLPGHLRYVSREKSLDLVRAERRKSGSARTSAPCGVGLRGLFSAHQPLRRVDLLEEKEIQAEAARRFSNAQRFKRWTASFLEQQVLNVGLVSSIGASAETKWNLVFGGRASAEQIQKKIDFDKQDGQFQKLPSEDRDKIVAYVGGNWVDCRNADLRRFLGVRRKGCTTIAPPVDPHDEDPAHDRGLQAAQEHLQTHR